MLKYSTQNQWNMPTSYILLFHAIEHPRCFETAAGWLVKQGTLTGKCSSNHLAENNRPRWGGWYGSTRRAPGDPSRSNYVYTHFLRQEEDREFESHSLQPYTLTLINLIMYSGNAPFEVVAAGSLRCD